LAFINICAKIRRITRIDDCPHKMKSTKKELFELLLRAPPGKLFLILPIGYTLFLQLITGIPKPGTLQKIDANELFVRLSAELFDYPYWLQDLSHLPLFFTLGWLWIWISRKPYNKGLFKNPASFVAFSYACFNELAQAFIPERFPSAGDLFMNLIGVSMALVLHYWLHRHSLNQKFPQHH